MRYVVVTSFLEVGTEKEQAKDLRGSEMREVRATDVVVISGAEYLRKSRLANQAEFLAAKEKGTK